MFSSSGVFIRCGSIYSVVVLVISVLMMWYMFLVCVGLSIGWVMMYIVVIV